MDDIFKTSMLLDFYGQLLTARQYEILDLYFNGDYSLSEIAEHLNISRQGVHDNIRKGKASLGTYEKKLGLLKRFLEERIKLEVILDSLVSVDISHMGDVDGQIVLNTIANVRELISEL